MEIEKRTAVGFRPVFDGGFVMGAKKRTAAIAAHRLMDLEATAGQLRASLRRRIGEIILVGLAYAISGRLGLFLAIPPGYASAIFPPSGIALAALR